MYQADQDMEELQDTLLRCAKLEARKRVADDQEMQLLARMSRDHKQTKLSNDAIYKYDEIEGISYVLFPCYMMPYPYVVILALLIQES